MSDSLQNGSDTRRSTNVGSDSGEVNHDEFIQDVTEAARAVAEEVLTNTHSLMDAEWVEVFVRWGERQAEAHVRQVLGNPEPIGSVDDILSQFEGRVIESFLRINPRALDHSLVNREFRPRVVSKDCDAAAEQLPRAIELGRDLVVKWADLRGLSDQQYADIYAAWRRSLSKWDDSLSECFSKWDLVDLCWVSQIGSGLIESWIGPERLVRIRDLFLASEHRAEHRELARNHDQARQWLETNECTGRCRMPTIRISEFHPPIRPTEPRPRGASPQ